MMTSIVYITTYYYYYYVLLAIIIIIITITITICLFRLLHDLGDVAPRVLVHVLQGLVEHDRLLLVDGLLCVYIYI